MIQFNEDEVCRILRAVTYYRDEVTGNEYMWDRYDELVNKVTQYGEDASPHPVSCDNNISK